MVSSRSRIPVNREGAGLLSCTDSSSMRCSNLVAHKVKLLFALETQKFAYLDTMHRIGELGVYRSGRIPSIVQNLLDEFES